MDTVIETTPKAKTRRKIKPHKKLISIRLDPVIHQQADQRAKADKRSFSQYVELVLEHHLKEQQELARHVHPGDVQGVWSAYDEFKAAEQLQALLKSTQA
jgi:hypothetical protein